MGIDTADERLEQLVRDYGRLIRAAVARALGPHTPLVGEDVEQEVVVALWKRLKSEQAIEHPPSYVFKAARREALRVLRREAARCFSYEGEAADLPQPRADGPMNNIEQREARERLQAALERLTAERRRAVQAHLLGFEVGELMEITGWPYQKARNLVARGMADLRRALSEVA